MRRLFMLTGLVSVLTLGGCAYFQTLQESPQFKEFCNWAPVAIAGIGQATVEASNDPAKQEVTRAMSQALVFLKLASAQCPVAPVVTP